MDALLTALIMELIGEGGEKFAVAAAVASVKGTEARFRAV